MKLALLLLLLASVTLVYPIYVVHKQALGEHIKIARTPTLWNAEYTETRFVTPEGLKLAGWWIPSGEKAVLLLHGKSGSRNGQHTNIFDLARWYHAQGYSILMPDLRAHGQSQGRYSGFGYKDADDMLGWIAQVDPQQHYRWNIHGFSMGAVVALKMKAARGERFEKIVADAPWIDFETLVRQELWKRAKLPGWSYPYMRLLARMLLDIDFAQADIRETLQQLDPEGMLFIFEADDRMINAHHRGVLQAALPAAHMQVFADSKHVEAFINRPAAYTDIVGNFLKENPKEP